MQKNNIQPFHLAIPVNDLEKSRDFYKNILGCKEGRSSNHWVDFNLFGHQLVIHRKEKLEEKTKQILLMEKMSQFHILELF